MKGTRLRVRSGTKCKGKREREREVAGCDELSRLVWMVGGRGKEEEEWLVESVRSMWLDD